jgi:sporulation protein YlmC with PRC-barrel domain
MLYFSELKGKRVVDQQNQQVGRLDDIVFRAEDQAVVTKLILRQAGDTVCVPVGIMKSINGRLVVQAPLPRTELSENELYVGKNLMDQQILDINGNKLVRVNDVVIQDKPRLIVSGVDIGLIGLLRWFGVE